MQQEKKRRRHSSDDSDLLKHLGEYRQQEIARWNLEQRRYRQYLAGQGSKAAESDERGAKKYTSAVIAEGALSTDDTSAFQGVVESDPTSTTAAFEVSHGKHCYEDDLVLDDEPTAAQVFLPLWKKCLRSLQLSGASADVPVVSQAIGKGDDEDVVNSSDLMKRLDEERRKEQYRLRQKKHRSIQPTSPGNSDFENEISTDERNQLLRKLQRALGAEGLDEGTCTACDRLALRQDSRRVEGTDLAYLNKMKKSLSVDNIQLPDILKQQYSSPFKVAALDGVLVSPRGIHIYTSEDGSRCAWFSVCIECDRSIQRCKLPKFAIANGFYIGRMPDFLDNLTIPERFMTQLASVVAMTRVMRGGRHRCIRSHCIAFDCTPGPPISMLPRSLDDVSSYRVVMVGEFTARQAEQVRKLRRIRNKKVRDVFAFYKANNHLYKDVTGADAVLSSEYTDDNIEQAFIEHVLDPGGALDDAMSREQQSVRGESDAWRVACDNNECSMIERRIGLVGDDTPVMIREHPVVANAGGAAEREFEIRRSNHIKTTYLELYWAECFLIYFLLGTATLVSTGRSKSPYKNV